MARALDFRRSIVSGHLCFCRPPNSVAKGVGCWANALGVSVQEAFRGAASRSVPTGKILIGSTETGCQAHERVPFPGRRASLGIRTDGRSSNGRTRAFGARCGGSNPPRPATAGWPLGAPMLRVGLTGGLASGKSFAASEFKRLGCAVLQADRLGHRILAEDSDVRNEIVREFGVGVLSGDGTISRKALSTVAFSDKERLGRLNAIVHPRVFAGLERFFDEVRTRDPNAVAMVEAAIMIESGSYRRYQRLVLAACPREMQIERFVRREGTSRQEAESRMARQMPLEEKRRFAHFVIDTSGTKAETLRQVRSVYQRLRAEAAPTGK